MELKINYELVPIYSDKVFDEGTWNERKEVIGFEPQIRVETKIYHSYPNCGEPDEYEFEAIGKTFDEAMKNLNEKVNKKVAYLIKAHHTKPYGDELNKYTF